MHSEKGRAQGWRWLGAAAAGIGGLAWFLRAWRPVSDVDCARLTAPTGGEIDLSRVLTARELREDTAALAAIQPRNSGTPGEIEARDWVRARFCQAGLQRVRLAPVLYPRWEGEGARVTLLGSPAVELPCIPLSGSAATPSEGIKGALVDVGGGQEVDYAALDRERTAGRIHVAFGGSLHRRDLCLNAGRAGALGVIVAHPDPQPVGSVGKPTFLVEAGTSVVLGRLPTVAVSHPVGQRLCAAAREGQSVRLNVARRYSVGRAANVVGEIPGRSQEYIVLVAHYDGWYSGAADNAAGVAGLLSLARAWVEGGRLLEPPQRTLRFLSTSSEEEGLMGSLSDVVLRGPAIKARCRGVVSLDIVGAPGENLWATGWPPQLAGAAAAIARGQGYEKATGNPVMVYQGRAYGDHWPYTLLRIPGVMLAKYPYRFYHTPFDTPDRLDYEDARLQVAIAGTLAWRLAGL
jgi:carboxypeptidase Q